MSKKLSLSTPIVGTQHHLSDFWQWAYSDVMNNRNRSILAEWLVGSALGVVDQVREEWDGCDLNYGKLKIEVKSAAYLQSWEQRVPSKIIYDIAHKRAWISAENKRSIQPVRFADIYVFCLFKEQSRETANVLDMEQWCFYVVLTHELVNERYGNAKTLSLKRLQDHCDTLGYNGIKSFIDRLALDLMSGRKET